MAQVLEFRLPDLGEGLTEAEIVHWLVEVGDVVAVDQPVVEVETAKAMVEVPCPYGGVVTARYGEEGSELPVGAPLLTVAVGASESAAGGEPAPEKAPAAPAADEGSGNVLVGYGTGAPAARRRRVRQASPAAAVPAPAPAPVVGRANGSGAPVLTPAGGSAGPAGPVAVVSPLVRRLARENGVDLRTLTGSGREGLILRSDVDRAIRSADPEPPAAVAAPTGAAGAAGRPDVVRCRCGVYGARSPTSCPAAATRSRTPPAGWTPTRRS